ncbi:hypothetical protein BC830DRAFT_1078399 [Chytriomyces sp. MP71]|nr:hypothetical protein BC830DRAFT_1078399 [Chytriomyces sp. MP71]
MKSFLLLAGPLRHSMGQPPERAQEGASRSSFTRVATRIPPKYTPAVLHGTKRLGSRSLPAHRYSILRWLDSREIRQVARLMTDAIHKFLFYLCVDIPPYAQECTNIFLI